jgi:hypothetical protein
LKDDEYTNYDWQVIKDNNIISNIIYEKLFFEDEINSQYDIFDSINIPDKNFEYITKDDEYINYDWQDIVDNIVISNIIYNK